MKKIYVYEITDKNGYTGTCSFCCRNKREADEAVQLYIRQWDLAPAESKYVKIEHSIERK